MTATVDLASELRSLAVTTGAVARFCDYVEHVEPADAKEVAAAAASLRTVALEMAAKVGCDAVERYGERLDDVERRYVLGVVDGFEAGKHVRLAESWRDLQLIQGRHDLLYRPDVTGLSRLDQLRHCSIHLAKLVGVLAAHDVSREELTNRVVPDTLLFGIKLANICGEVLSSEPVFGTAKESVSSESMQRD
jgi:hypothetical protein